LKTVTATVRLDWTVSTINWTSAKEEYGFISAKN